jgi:hypothetical protein
MFLARAWLTSVMVSSCSNLLTNLSGARLHLDHTNFLLPFSEVNIKLRSRMIDMSWLIPHLHRH